MNKLNELVVDVLFLKAERFEFQGQKGQVIAFNCKFVHGGTVFKAKLSQPIYEKLKDLEQTEVRLQLSVESNKEVLSVRVIDVL